MPALPVPLSDSPATGQGSALAGGGLICFFCPVAAAPVQAGGAGCEGEGVPGSSLLNQLHFWA